MQHCLHLVLLILFLMEKNNFMKKKAESIPTKMCSLYCRILYFNTSRNWIQRRESPNSEFAFSLFRFILSKLLVFLRNSYANILFKYKTKQLSFIYNINPRKYFSNTSLFLLELSQSLSTPGLKLWLKIWFLQIPLMCFLFHPASNIHFYTEIVVTIPEVLAFISWSLTRLLQKM